MLTLQRTCPLCDGGEIYTSRYRGLDFLLRLIYFRPVRCGECHWRYYQPVSFFALDRTRSEHDENWNHAA
jgi:hypothetical protein